MEKVRAHYTTQDSGCWIDCAYGTGHAISKVRSMLIDCGCTAPIMDELDSASADDEFIGEVLDDATEALYLYTEEGLDWVWDGGDLLLSYNDCE